MTGTEMNNITSPATGLVIFVTNDSSFYYYKNSGWIKLVAGETGWTVDGNVVYNTSSNVGIGTSTPNARLSISTSNNDTTLYLYNSQIDTSDQYGSFMDLYKYTPGSQFGVYNHLYNNSSDLNYNNLTGVYNIIQGNSGSFIYGSYNYIFNSGNNNHYET
jgi:hypothetical protein